MSSLLDGRWTLGGGLHAADDGGGTLLPGETATAGKVVRVCGRLGSGVSSIKQAGMDCAGRRNVVEKYRDGIRIREVIWGAWEGVEGGLRHAD